MPATVLLVEDEVVVRALVAESLRAAGLTVVEAANADEAWAYLAAGGAPDLMFSDVSMPGSMDGIALTKRVREAFPDVKIVITSGNLGPIDLTQFDRFIQKPFSFTHAVDVMAEMLGVTPLGPA
jgi:CheY-like chemotaxis protein